MAAPDPIAGWHDYMRAPSAERLAALLHEDCVFQSPAVHTPQKGKALTMKYLLAAAEVLGGKEFRYVGEWRGERSAVLEFECAVDGKYVNGVDIIAWDADGRFTGFKVMIRPIKAFEAVVPRMAAALAG
ncbi:nuclear transport factor 2 family protein [uncultured Sphingomonas sp.]|uniref:nuclear transport factor 2 family protein n=1 Tax=uncultured Sphingomonas sp. TaxID=158754 RepID=UPI002609E3BE|nr:nuclear transport factor 2 family protein [uncultured Sphingomonas sp.]